MPADGPGSVSVNAGDGWNKENTVIKYKKDKMWNEEEEELAERTRERERGKKKARRWEGKKDVGST